MTTNSFGSNLPRFDFPTPKAAPPRYPRAGGRLLPVISVVTTAALVTFYASPEDSWQREAITRIFRPQKAAQEFSATAMRDATRQNALNDAYGGRESLEDLQAAQQAYQQRWERQAPKQKTETHNSRWKERDPLEEEILREIMYEY